MSGDNVLWEKVEKIKQAEKKPARKTKPQKSKKVDRNRDTVTPRHRAAEVSRGQETKSGGKHDTTTPAIVETIRKGVRQQGKEAATHRFTAEEKQAIADIVYTYGKEGYRTSENEIARIGLHWLIQDYQEKGRQSVLAKVLEALNG